MPDEQSMKDMAKRMQARHDAAIEAVRRSWGPQIENAAGELIGTGVTVVLLDGGQVRGPMVSRDGFLYAATHGRGIWKTPLFLL